MTTDDSLQDRVRALAADTLPRGVKDALRRKEHALRKKVRQRRRARERRENKKISAAQVKAVYEAQHAPIDAGRVFYESFGGRGMLCNPEAIFRYVLSAPEYAHLSHVWALDDLEAHPAVTSEFTDDPRVTFVEVGSDEYYRALATSRYLVNNTSFPPAFRKRDGQVYLNTWHGTPLKAMGYDVAGGREDTRNVVRNFLQTDLLLSPSRFVTDSMYRSAFRLEGIFRGAVIEDGYPRIERGLAWAGRSQALRADLSAYGFELTRERMVVYAPTWRGSSPYQAKADLEGLREVLEALLGAVDPSTTQVALKVHQFVYDAVRETDLQAYLVPNDVPTNLVLAGTDVLVTDYSSIFVDFLPFDRPVAFYVPDPDGYAAERGSSFTEDELPGGVVRDAAQLAALVASGLADPNAPATRPEARRAWAETYCGWDGEGATARVAAALLSGTEHERARRDFATDKKRVLIYLGGLLNNGITTSALNLLSRIDYDRYDVTAAYTSANASVSVDRIDPHVRVLPRVGRVIQGGDAERNRQHFENRGARGRGVDRALLDQLFREEWHRCFGAAEFDHIIDFSGYSSFWAALMLAGSAPVHTVWMHNDLEEDARRTIDGARPHEKNLNALFSLYDGFDNLVSVSPTLSRINREKLGRYAPRGRFVAIENLLDGDLVVDEGLGSGVKPGSATTVARRPVPRRSEPEGLLAQEFERLEASFGAEQVAREATRRMLAREWVGDDPATRVFVTVGRLSPEKNQACAIEAFALVHAEVPDTKLVIVGGGPLERALRAQAKSLDVADAVAFAGHQPNPHAIMAASDCFVFSSNYEGQGLAILEARRLGLPVVTTRFNVVDDVVPPEAGIITEPSPEGLADGMRAFLRGEVSFEPFDVVAYNARIVAGLNELLESKPAASAG